MELLAHRILGHFRNPMARVGGVRTLGKYAPDDPKTMKLVQDVHLVSLRDIHERHIDRSTTSRPTKKDN